MKLIAYLSNGYPSLEAARKRGADFVDAGVEILEVDFPSPDPYLDSDYLKQRIFSALKKNDNYDDYAASILQMQKELPHTEFLINIYVECIEAWGVENFVAFMKKLGQNEVLLVGNGDPSIRETLEKEGLYASCYVTREMKAEDLARAEVSNGFVYLQAFAEKESCSDDFPTLKDCVAKVRETIGDARKIYCGVGIHTPERLREVYEAGADGAFLGSIVLKKEDAGEDVLGYIRNLKKIAQGES